MDNFRYATSIRRLWRRCHSQTTPTGWRNAGIHSYEVMHLIHVFLQARDSPGGSRSGPRKTRWSRVEKSDPLGIGRPRRCFSNFPAEHRMRALLMVFLLHIGLVGSANADQPKDVSMIQLIADPQRFDGQAIRIIGFLRLEYEGNAVYLHREDFEKSILQNGIWIDLTDSQLRSSSKLNNGYVLVEGTFSSSEKGHLGLWPGSLRQVSRLSNWSVDRSRRIRPKR
jgi:hypothetical protein